MIQTSARIVTTDYGVSMIGQAYRKYPSNSTIKIILYSQPSLPSQLYYHYDLIIYTTLRTQYFQCHFFADYLTSEEAAMTKIIEQGQVDVFWVIW